jgi:excisionase family DNA binding protein
MEEGSVPKGDTSAQLFSLLRDLIRAEVHACLGHGAPPRSPEPAPTDPPDPGSVIDVADLAALLGVERKTVYHLIQLGHIPGVRRLGRTIRIHPDTVLSWLRNGQGSVPRSRRTP